MAADAHRGGRLRERCRNLAFAVSWTPPTSTEVGVVVKSGLAAGLSWLVAESVTDIPAPVLAPLTAIVVVQVSVRASIMSALQRSAAVVLGVLLAVAIGDALGLNALTVAGIVVGSLGFAELVLRLPRPAARQVPISALVVLAAISATPATTGWWRALDTVIGAAVGVSVSLVLPASRVVDARQTLGRLGTSIAAGLQSMSDGLREEWSVEQTEDWRRQARTTRERLVRQAAEAVGNSREAARWNIRDRRHVAILVRYEEALPRLERTAIGVSIISRGLDDHARLSGTGHQPMAAMGALLESLAVAVRAMVDDVLGASDGTTLAGALDDVRERRARCVLGASRRARIALEHDEGAAIESIEGEWLNYAALLVQVDRIVGDLSAPLPP